ncbi:MAG: hypothetical protein UR66_C0003G0002 [Candidatus Moranbacteria bacterium GW2011_GWE1_35_17]|nr:MAG: hypothetical protein UR66_C0003G0002 [Candidatus Moranbacteria bacterium GW2011_GWE1_35_17]KKP82928.1 MAG: hypothetical protein UR82_C0027G0002 [Candidatus Moranbacteria bacterium GW2011_GWF1_35_5]KKP83297.1 MAG: hypothetical protein UR83_C0037G0002 [Candidatus Moranbacteria bacterium GW2011_GWF2_35_54]
MENKNDDVLELMRSYELLLKDLYALFALKISEEKEFWLKLSEEENKHAYWLEVLGANMQKQNISLNGDDRFNLPLMKSSISHIQESLEDFKKVEISLFDALTFASDMENSMIEKKFFEVFYGINDDFDRVMKLLKEETIAHSQRIEEKLKKCSTC